MNLNVSGHHVEVTPALRDYLKGKLERVEGSIEEGVGKARRKVGELVEGVAKAIKK